MRIQNIKNIKKTRIYKINYGIFLSISFYLISILIALSNVAGGKYFFYFVLTIGSINLVYEIYIVVSHLRKNDLESFYDTKKFQIYKNKQMKLFKIQFIILLLVLLTPAYYVGGTYLFTNTESELYQIVNDLVDESMNETQRVNVILSWFNRGGDKLNFSNMYYRTKEKDVLLGLCNSIFVYDAEPFFGFRLLDEPKWIIASKCGMCGETATLFREMGVIAGLNVSSAYCVAEDHVWNEVYLNGINEPLIIDATAIDSSKNNSKLYQSEGFMEEKIAGDQRRAGEKPEEGNVSFVYCEFKGESKKHDVTYRYTDIINLTINVSDSNGKPIKDCSVKIKSYNRPGKEGSTSWGLNKTTDEFGQCTFSIGGGRYKFDLKQEGDWFSMETNLVRFWEDESKQYFNIEYKSRSIIDVIFGMQ